MPIEVELPDGSIAEFPDNMNPEDIQSILSKQFGQQEQPGFFDNALDFAANAGGRTLRAGATGLTGTADFLATPFREGLNWANEKLGGSPDYFQPLTSHVVRGLDNAGVARPEGALEEALDSVGASLAGGGGLIKGAQLIGGLANAGTKTAQVADFLSAQPKLQGVSAATGTIAAEGAKAKGADETGQIVAGLFGGMAPVPAQALRHLGRGVGNQVRPFYSKGQQQLAGQALGDTYTSGRGLADRIDNLMPQAEIIPGSHPTTAQLTGDYGAASLEKGLRNSGINASRFNARGQEQVTARNNFIQENIGNLESFPGAASSEFLPEMGGAIRGAYNDAYTAAKQSTSRAYNAIDPLGTSRFDIKPLANDFNMAKSKYFGAGSIGSIPPELTRMENVLKQYVKQNIEPPHSVLQSMRNGLSTLENQAAQSGNRQVKAMASELKGSIDGMVENAGPAFTPEQAIRAAQARQLRISQGQNFESGANQILAGRGKQADGSKIGVAEIPRNYFKSGPKGYEATQDFFRSVGNNPEAKDAMHDYAMARFNSALFTQHGGISPAKAKKWVQDHSGALRSFPQLKKSLEEIVDAVSTDIGRQRAADSAVAVRGSDTALNQALMDDIGRMAIRGPLRHTPFVGSLLNDAKGNVKNYMINASLDPVEAARLLRMAPRELETPAQVFNRSIQALIPASLQLEQRGILEMMKEQ